MVTDGSMFSINPLIYSKLTYDPAKDFVPVALVARAALFLALHPKMPPTTLKEWVDYVKANAGKQTTARRVSAVRTISQWKR